MVTQFKIGDIVQLKSGGPQMTVLGVTPVAPGTEWCGVYWFAGDTLRSAEFRPEVLRPFHNPSFSDTVER